MYSTKCFQLSSGFNIDYAERQIEWLNALTLCICMNGDVDGIHVALDF